LTLTLPDGGEIVIDAMFYADAALPIEEGVAVNFANTTGLAIKTRIQFIDPAWEKAVPKGGAGV
jgi:hypothetical protein